MFKVLIHVRGELLLLLHICSSGRVVMVDATEIQFTYSLQSTNLFGSTHERVKILLNIHKI